MGFARQVEDMSFVDLSGKTHHLSDYKGKWIIVNYWASWCPPCMDEIPELVAFHDSYAKDKAVVLGVYYGDYDLQYLTQFSDEFFISYPVLLMDDHSPQMINDIYVLPTTFIISPIGELIATEKGGITKAILESYLIENVEDKLEKKLAQETILK